MADIESLLREKRVFEPAKAFAKQAVWTPRQVAAYRKLSVGRGPVDRVVLR